jgi:hypothetical protein
VREAVVRLVGESKLVVQFRTDDLGRAVFRELADGAYRLSVSAPGYVPLPEEANSVGFTISRLETSGVSEVALERTGEIRGSVATADRVPVSSANVWAMPVSVGHEPRAMAVITVRATTDDRGQFTLPNLAPGRFLVRTARLPLGDIAGTRIGVAAVYYPSASSASGATPIDVVPGAVVEGIQLTAPTESLLDVSGRLESDLGPCAGQLMQLRPGLPDDVDHESVPVGGDDLQARSDAACGFTFKDVPQGHYRLTGVMDHGYVSEPVFVTSFESSRDVVVRIKRPLRVKGRVVVEQAAGLVDSPLPPHVALELLGPGRSLNDARTRTVAVASDGTFEVDHLFPARYIVRSVGKGAPTVVELETPSGARPAGPLSIDGDVTGLVVRTSHALGGLEVVVGTDTARYLVVFPASRAAWSDSLSDWARFRRVRVASTGSTLIDRLPPGQYRVAAVPVQREHEALTPELLSALVADATGASSVAYSTTRVELGAGRRR